jgi:LmbE family N-acetylglucosaminyl deacetylase
VVTSIEAVEEDWQRAVAVVAHPDDLEYGCAVAGREHALTLQRFSV